MRHCHSCLASVILALAVPFACVAQDVTAVAKEVETQINRLQSGVSSEQEKAAIDALATLGLPAVPDIAREMREGNHPQAIGGAEALKKIGAPAIDALVTQLSSNASSKSRADAALALRSLADAHAEGLDKTTDALVKALDDMDEVVAPASKALAVMHPASDEIYLILTRKLLARGYYAYKEALETMTAAPEEAVGLLAHAIGDQDWQISRQSYEVLLGLGPRAKSAASTLTEYLYEPPFPQRNEIPSVLISVSGDEAVPVLVKLLVSQADNSLKLNTLTALDSSGTAVNKENLVRLLLNALSSDTFYPATALSRPWVPAIEALVTATANPDALTRQNAIYALGQAAYSLRTAKTPPSPAIVPALEAVLFRDNLAARCLAAIALLQVPGAESSVAALERAIADPRNDDAGRRVLSDALFHASTPPEDGGTPPLPRYTLIKKQLATDNPDQRRFSYLIQLAGEGEPTFLDNLDEYRVRESESRYYFRRPTRLDESSVRLAWIAPPFLLQTSWLNVATEQQGPTMSTTSIIAKTESGWKEIARRTEKSLQYYSSERPSSPLTFRYNPKTQSLHLLSIGSVRESLKEPAPLAYGSGREYCRSFTKIQEWPCAMTGGNLRVEPGIEKVSAVGEFPPAEYAATFNTTEEALRTLNPHLRNRKHWTGAVYTSVTVPPISFDQIVGTTTVQAR